MLRRLLPFAQVHVDTCSTQYTLVVKYVNLMTKTTKRDPNMNTKMSITQSKRVWYTFMTQDHVNLLFLFE